MFACPPIAGKSGHARASRLGQTQIYVMEAISVQFCFNSRRVGAQPAQGWVKVKSLSAVLAKFDRSEPIVEREGIWLGRDLTAAMR